jgi:hypothetical protein
MNEQALNAVYLFIAELMGYKQGTVTDKLLFGQECYAGQALPEVTEEHLHEVIWLERLYKELDKLNMYRLMELPDDQFHWSVPIELDCSGSMISYMGVLLGDKRMLEATNAAGDDEQLRDPWHIDGLTRNHVKKACTPKLYGSGQTVHALWVNNKLDYTLEDLNLMNQEMKAGMFGTADKFKEFIINNCNPKPVMTVRVWNDTFEIKCNRHTRIGETPVKYDLFDTESGGIKRITHMKTKAIPDLEGFRRFFVTCLIHGLDSQVMDTVAGKCFDKYGFAIDIHDALICSPLAAADVRMWYAEEMDKIYVNRKEILSNYFSSIGVTAMSMKEWEAVNDSVFKIGEFKCRGAVLK